MKNTLERTWRTRSFPDFTFHNYFLVPVLLYLLNFGAYSTTAQNFQVEINKTRTEPQYLDLENKPVSTDFNKSQNVENEIGQESNDSPVQRILIRRKRQDDGDDDGDDGDAGAAAGAGAAAAVIPNRPTIPPQIGLFPQVANLVRVLFGGNGQQVNFTNFVGSATKLLPRPIGNQVLGIVKTFANENNPIANPALMAFNTLQGQLTGQPPINFNLESNAPSLTQEQILALGLPPQSGLNPGSQNLNQNLNGLTANGITPEQLLALGLPVPGGSGLNGKPSNGQNQNGLEANGITQEQLLALGLPVPGGGGSNGKPNSNGQNQNINGLEANGITQEQLLALGIPIHGGGGGGFNGRPSNSIGQNRLPRSTTPAVDLFQGIPGGLTAADIQALQALGVPDLEQLLAAASVTQPPPQRSTRKPRPQYTVNKQPNPQRQQSNQFQNLQNPNLFGQQQQQQQQNQENTNRFQNQELAFPPTPSPNYLPTYVKTRNPQFANSEKDVLPLNLNPNHQSISQLQAQQQQQQNQPPKYQGTPASPLNQPPNFPPQTQNNYGQQLQQQQLQNQNNFQQQPNGGVGGAAFTPQQLQQIQQHLLQNGGLGLRPLQQPTTRATTLSPLQHLQNLLRPPPRPTVATTTGNPGDEDESEEDEIEGFPDEFRKERKPNLSD